MKKVLYVVLAAALACIFCGCGKKDAAADKYTLVMNGKAVSAPVTVESLGKDYDLSFSVMLRYKGEPVTGVKLDESSTEQDELKKPIKFMVRSLICSDKTDFSIGGIELGDTMKDVLNVYGQPTYKDEPLNIWKYCKDGKSEDDYWLGFQFAGPDPEKITSIYFGFE